MKTAARYLPFSLPSPAAALASATAKITASAPVLDSPKDHLIDKVIERLLSSALSDIPPNSLQGPDHCGHTHHDSNSTSDAKSRRKETKELLREQGTTTEQDVPELSLSILASHIRKLNSRAGVFLKWQSMLVHVFSWHQPALTLSVLFVNTYLCLYPQLVVGLPIVFVLTGIMAPGFDKRHPLPANLLPTKYFKRHGLGAEAEEFEMPSLAESLRAQNKEKRDKAILELVRDLQNFLQMLVNAIEAVERFVNGVGSFQEEEKASALYLLLMAALVVVIYIASLLPANVAVCVVSWVSVLLCHPGIQKQLKAATAKPLFSRNQTTQTPAPTPVVPKKRKDWLAQLSRSEIILDEAPEVRQVEIFELQRQGLTPRMWDPWVYTPLVYDVCSASRVGQCRPPGTRFLGDVEAPAGWFFADPPTPSLSPATTLDGSNANGWEESEKDGWTLDKQPKHWVAHRALRGIEMEVGEAWAYDCVDGERGEWRRRRWVRNCYRYEATS